MPTVHREGGYRFFFWSNENDEPPHVHVEHGDSEAKFWLENVELAENYGVRKPATHADTIDGRATPSDDVEEMA